MSRPPIELLSDPEQIRAALAPMRRQLLERLRQPASATELAAELGTSRQRISYHLRALEEAGLLELVEERRRRGCVERILGVRADRVIVDPTVMGRGAPAEGEPDPFSSDHLVGVAAGVVGALAEMRSAGRPGTRPATFTITTEVSLAGTADVGHFKAALAHLVARAVAEFDAPTIGKRYRVVIGGYPVEERVDKSEHKL